jgi:hypothetical protein
MDANFGKPKPAITGSVVIEDQANYYNQNAVCSSSGEIQFMTKDIYSL